MPSLRSAAVAYKAAKPQAPRDLFSSFPTLLTRFATLLVGLNRCPEVEMVANHCCYFYVSFFLFASFRGGMGCCCGTLEGRVNARFEQHEILAQEILSVSLQFQRSRGFSQITGNGALVLTTDMLWFCILCPRIEIVMPLGSILAVGVGRSPLQDTLGLGVEFVNPTIRMEDQVVFSLRGISLWKTLIDVAKGNFEKLERRVSQRFEASRIIRKEILWTANRQYQTSLSPNQVLGKGALVLTSDMLCCLLLPDKEIEMPLQNIRAVLAHTQRGKPPMLEVSLVDEDQVIFISKDPKSWKRMIDETIQGGQNRL